MNPNATIPSLYRVYETDGVAGNDWIEHVTFDRLPPAAQAAVMADPTADRWSCSAETDDEENEGLYLRIYPVS